MRELGAPTASAAATPGTIGTPRSGAAVSIDGLGKRYGAIVALRPTSLEIAAGEFFSLIGPSGSGKTTLLAAIAGFVAPTSGDIRIDGKSILALPPYRRAVGMVFQNYSLFPHMNVFDNVAFPLRMRKVAKAEIEARVRRMLGIVRLAHVAERAPGQLSGGQQQRIALARAAIYDAPLLLMDEPLGALDKNLREEMQFEIKQFHERIGTTIIYVTHDQDEAATMSDRIAILNHGQLEQIGSPRQLYEQPANAFVASFLGQANLFTVVRVAAAPGGRLALRTDRGLELVAKTMPSARGNLVACVRPEAVLLDDLRPPTANCLAGTVHSCVFTAGSVWYRVQVGDMAIAARKPAHRAVKQHAPGAAVHVGWDEADTLLIISDQAEGSHGSA